MKRGSFHGHEYHLSHAILMIAGAIALFGGGTMLLWNALLPSLLTLPKITFLQACGLVVLTRLLFGSHGHAMMFFAGRHHGGHGFHGDMHDRFHQRWNQMTPEERKRFRERFRHTDCDFWGRDPDETTSTETKTSENQPSS